MADDIYRQMRRLDTTGFDNQESPQYEFCTAAHWIAEYDADSRRIRLVRFWDFGNGGEPSAELTPDEARSMLAAMRRKPADTGFHDLIAESGRAS